MQKLKTLTNKCLRHKNALLGVFFMMLAALGGVFWTIQPTWAATDMEAIEYYDGTNWVALQLNNAETGWPAGMSWDDTEKELVLNGYDGGAIRREGNSAGDRLEIRVVGTNNKIHSTEPYTPGINAQYGIASDGTFVSIRGAEGAKLSILVDQFDNFAIWTSGGSVTITDITLETDAKFATSTTILDGSATLVVNTVNDRPFFKLRLQDESNVDVTVNTAVNESLAYGAQKLELLGTGRAAL